MTRLPPLPVNDSSGVGAVRRVASALAEQAGFGEHDVARVALVATEMASNLVKHARDGVMVLQTGADERVPTVELLAVDRGPGIRDLADALADGRSSAGTAGTGFGAIARVATRFDVHSKTEVGTVVLAVVAAGTAAPAVGFDAGGVSLPYPGEDTCGDGFAIAVGEGRALVLVTDGLGHGPLAHAASERAAEMFRRYATEGPVEVMQRLHDAMRDTRGAAAALAEVDARRGLVRYCGVGNIAATIVHQGATRSLVSHHGTLGHDARRIAEFQYPWPPGALLVMHSDGLTGRWTLAGYAGLGERASSLIAAVLCRDSRRQRDDTTAVVVKERT